MGFISKGLKNQFEKAMANEPSVFEPLKFYCIGNRQVTNKKQKSGEIKGNQVRVIVLPHNNLSWLISTKPVRVHI